MGWAALLKTDLVALAKSWVWRGWVLLLALTGFFTLAGLLAANRAANIPASTVLTQQLVAYLLLWSTVIIVITAGSVSLEADMIADGILSRSCTRTQYILAKLAARACMIVGTYLLFSGVTGYCVWRYASNDVTLATMATAIGIVGMALLLLISLGIAMSVIFNNTVFSVIGLLMLWYVASPIFNFLGAEYLSPVSLQRNLPGMLKDSRAPQVVQCTATPSSVTVTFSKAVAIAQAEQVDNYVIEDRKKETQTARSAVYDEGRTSVVLGGLQLKAGEKVKVTVRGVVDAAGNEISPAADSSETSVTAQGKASAKEGANDIPTPTVSSDAKTRIAPAKGPRRRLFPGNDRRAPRVTECTATASSLKVIFSEDVNAKDAERVANYTIESPLGKTHTARTATYNPEARSVLLSGLHFATGDPVKVTVRGVHDLDANAIEKRNNSAIYTEVTTWKYVLGFGLPTIALSILAVAWFSHRDL